MNLYDDFSKIYNNKYLEYSKKMSEIFPLLIKNYTDKTDNILDLACGEGTFCRELTKKGFQVEGVDLSEQQIENAKKKSKKEDLNINFYNENIIDFKIDKKYDVITSWFDSLNYIIHKNDIKKVFINTFNMLNDNGVFMFDMNTIHGLITLWNDLPYYIFEDTDDLFEVHKSDYDYENNLAYMKIIFFLRRDNNKWEKFEEEHIEKGYKKTEINELLTSVGFNEIYFYGNLNPLLPDSEESNRMYVVAIK
ncbi:MAG: class I SAM-dependent DNA methyltransferase [Thermotogota bacterium]